RKPKLRGGASGLKQTRSLRGSGEAAGQSCRQTLSASSSGTNGATSFTNPAARTRGRYRQQIAQPSRRPKLRSLPAIAQGRTASHSSQKRSSWQSCCRLRGTVFLWPALGNRLGSSILGLGDRWGSLTGGGCGGGGSAGGSLLSPLRMRAVTGI